MAVRSRRERSLPGVQVSRRLVRSYPEHPRANPASDKGKTPAFDIPTIREYFVDLEKVLNVIADGPTKSFAFRRINYLASKFTMYSLLNESHELAEIKQVPHRCGSLHAFIFYCRSLPVGTQ